MDGSSSDLAEAREVVRRFLLGYEARNRVAGFVAAGRADDRVGWDIAVTVTDWLDGRITDLFTGMGVEPTEGYVVDVPGRWASSRRRIGWTRGTAPRSGRIRVEWFAWLQADGDVVACASNLLQWPGYRRSSVSACQLEGLDESLLPAVRALHRQARASGPG